jgi:hypothetical protein
MNQLLKTCLTILFSLVFAGLYLNLSSCKKISNPNSNRDIKDTITYDLMKTRIFIQFVDAKTDENIGSIDGRTLTVKLVGNSKNTISDIIGIQKDIYYPINGFLTLALLPEYSPGGSTPVIFTLISRMNNYVTSSKEIIITSDGDYIIKVKMINMDDPPEGVIIEKMFTVGTLYNGTLHSDVSIATPNNEVSITIPAGTILTDNDNNYLKRFLNLTLVYYNINDDKAMGAVTGGIAGSMVKNNTRNSVTFFPASIFDFVITDSEMVQADNIENKELQIEIKVPDGTYNPNTGGDFKINDIIEVYTYMPDTGMWNYYGADTVLSGVSSDLSVTTTSSELSDFSFSITKINGCNEGSVFTISGDCQDCGSVQLDGVIRKQADDTYVSDISLAGFRNKEMHTPLSTGNTDVYINWNQANDCNTCIVNPSISPLIIDNMCDQQPTQLPLLSTMPISYFVNADFAGRCISDTNYVILPSFGIWIRPYESKCWRWVSMDKGKSVICNLIYGETYIFGTYFNEIWQEWEVIIDNESNYSFTILFKDEDCNSIFGIL